MTLIRGRSQPMSSFSHILQNPLPEQIARAQTEFAFALALLSRLSVPEDRLAVILAAKFFIRENVSQNSLRGSVAFIGGFPAPADGCVDIVTVLGLQIPLCKLDHGWQQALVGSLREPQNGLPIILLNPFAAVI